MQLPSAGDGTPATTDLGPLVAEAKQLGAQYEAISEPASPERWDAIVDELLARGVDADDLARRADLLLGPVPPHLIRS